MLKFSYNISLINVLPYIDSYAAFEPLVVDAILRAMLV